MLTSVSCISFQFSSCICGGIFSYFFQISHFNLGQAFSKAWCQILTVSNCPFFTVVSNRPFFHVVKLSAVSNCPFLFTVSNCPVSNCPRCQIVRGVKLSGVKLSGVKLSAVSNCPRCQIVLVSNCPPTPALQGGQASSSQATRS